MVRVGGRGGQTWARAWAWRVGRMGRAGTAQGEPLQQPLSSAGGPPLFPQEQPSSEQPQGGAGQAEAVRVTAAEIVLLRR